MIVFFTGCSWPGIVRSAVSVPRATSQLLLNLTLSACYVVAGVIDISIAENLPEKLREPSGLSGPLDNTGGTAFAPPVSFTSV